LGTVARPAELEPATDDSGIHSLVIHSV
jgi:hypothetical protein